MHMRGGLCTSPHLFFIRKIYPLQVPPISLPLFLTTISWFLKSAFNEHSPSQVIPARW